MITVTTDGTVSHVDPYSGHVARSFRVPGGDAGSAVDVKELPAKALVVQIREHVATASSLAWGSSGGGGASAAPMAMRLPEAATCVAISPDASAIAVGTRSGLVYLWDAESGRLLHRRAVHLRAVTALAWTGPMTLLSAGDDGRAVHSAVGVHGPETPLAVFSEHSLPIRALWVSPVGRARFVTASADATARIWDLTSGSHASLAGLQFPLPLTVATMDSREARLFVGAVGGDVFAVDLSEAARVDAALVRVVADGGSQASHKRFKGHSADVRALCCSPDGRLLVSASADGSTRVWDVQSAMLLRVLDSQKAPIVHLAAALPMSHYDFALQTAGAVSAALCLQPLRGYLAMLQPFLNSQPESSSSSQAQTAWNEDALDLSASVDRRLAACAAPRVVLRAAGAPAASRKVVAEPASAADRDLPVEASSLVELEAENRRLKDLHFRMQQVLLRLLQQQLPEEAEGLSTDPPPPLLSQAPATVRKKQRRS